MRACFGAGLKSISTCLSLSSLKLGICLNITDRGLSYIGRGCSNLRELDLYRLVIVFVFKLSFLAVPISVSCFLLHQVGGNNRYRNLVDRSRLLSSRNNKHIILQRHHRQVLGLILQMLIVTNIREPGMSSHHLPRTCHHCCSM